MRLIELCKTTVYVTVLFLIATLINVIYPNDLCMVFCFIYKKILSCPKGILDLIFLDYPMISSIIYIFSLLLGIIFIYNKIREEF